MIRRINFVTITSSDIEIYNLEDEWVLIDKTQEKVAIMNETAFVLWEHIKSESKITIQELYNFFAKKYCNVGNVQLEQDFIETIDLLIREKLIHEI